MSPPQKPTPAAEGHRLLPWSVPDWMDLALCRETDPDAFFPEKGGSTRAAKQVCRRCDVRPECLQYALDGHERFGIFGGMSEPERRRLSRSAA